MIFELKGDDLWVQATNTPDVKFRGLVLISREEGSFSCPINDELHHRAYNSFRTLNVCALAWNDQEGNQITYDNVSMGISIAACPHLRVSLLNIRDTAHFGWCHVLKVESDTSSMFFIRSKYNLKENHSYVVATRLEDEPAIMMTLALCLS